MCWNVMRSVELACVVWLAINLQAAWGNTLETWLTHHLSHKGGQMAKRLGNRAINQKVASLIPGRAKWRCVLGQGTLPCLPRGEFPCTYWLALWIRESAKWLNVNKKYWRHITHTVHSLIWLWIVGLLNILKIQLNVNGLYKRDHSHHLLVPFESYGAPSSGHFGNKRSHLIGIWPLTTFDWLQLFLDTLKKYMNSINTFSTHHIQIEPRKFNANSLEAQTHPKLGTLTMGFPPSVFCRKKECMYQHMG